ncbi:diguanylate cyclase [Geminicoccaceae bacterium 1502E]|nr:diguanylate cyclase [Geminicoccaceae bacterium 1502E]
MGDDEALRAIFQRERRRVPVFSWGPSEASIRPPQLRRLHRLWSALQDGSGLLPAAAAAAKRLGPLADELALVEAVGGGTDFRFVHLGPDLVRQCGGGLQDMLLSKPGLWPDGFLAAACGAVLKRGEPLHVAYEPPEEALSTACEQLILPVAAAPDGRHRLLLGISAEGPLHAMVETVPDAALVVDPMGVIRLANRPAELLFGKEPADLLAHPVGEVIEDWRLPAAAGAGPLAMAGRHADGTTRSLEVSVGEAVHGSLRLHLAILRDVSGRRLPEAEIRRLAMYDPLTGLATASTLWDRLDHALARARRERRMVALAMFELAGFRPVDGSAERLDRDAVHRAFAGVLNATVRATDTAARLEGGAFALLQTDVRNARDAHALGGRLLPRLRQPIAVLGREAVLEISVGVALYPTHAANADELLERAGRALGSARREGGSGFEVYGATAEQE